MSADSEGSDSVVHEVRGIANHLQGRDKTQLIGLVLLILIQSAWTFCGPHRRIRN
jgi:hypothetical protein